MNQLEHDRVEEGDQIDKVHRSRTLRRGSCPTLPTIERQSRDAALLAHITDLIAQVLDFTVVESPSEMPNVAEAGCEDVVPGVEHNRMDTKDSCSCTSGVNLDTSTTHSEDVDSDIQFPQLVARKLRKLRSRSLVMPSQAHTLRSRLRSQSMAIPSTESHLLRQSVAKLVLELTEEQHNLRFAATAGSALLEQLELAKEKGNALRHQLHSQQNDLDTVKNENTRLKQICHRMEVELQEYYTLWSERQSRELDQGEGRTQAAEAKLQRSSHTPVPLSACHDCEKLREVIEQMRHETQALKRRSIELELQQDKAENRWSEIASLHKKSEGCLTRVQIDYTKVLSEIDFMSAQIKYLNEDHCQLLASRDSIMAASRNLRSANEELTTQLEQANNVIERLKTEKSTHDVRAQIAENRIATLAKENHAQFETTKSLLTRIHELELNQTDTHALRAHAEDLEQLVSAVNRERDEVREENQRLLIQLRSQTTEKARQPSVEESDKSSPVPQFNESNLGEILSIDSQYRASQSTDLSDIQSENELKDHQNTHTARSDACGTTPGRASLSSPSSDTKLGSVTGTPRVSKRPSLVYTRPSRGRRHRLSSQVAPIRRRKVSDDILSTPKLSKRRRSSVASDNMDVDDDGNIMEIMTTPLCLGLSILACATAVRYIIKK